MNNITQINKSKKQMIFHGGCHGCTQQSGPTGTEICKGCQYLNANWSLPDLNNEPPSVADIERSRLNKSTVILPPAVSTLFHRLKYLFTGKLS